jgi:hypothetical protein
MSLLQKTKDAELALIHAQDAYADAKRELALASCPYQVGGTAPVVFRNRDAKILVDIVLARLRKDGEYEWVVAGYIQYDDAKVRTNYRTEVTGLITE